MAVDLVAVELPSAGLPGGALRGVPLVQVASDGVACGIHVCGRQRLHESVRADPHHHVDDDARTPFASSAPESNVDAAGACLAMQARLRFRSSAEAGAHSPSRVRQTLRLVALLDRLLHHSNTLNIRGDSYRQKHRRQAGLPTTISQEDAMR